LLRKSDSLSANIKDEFILVLKKDIATFIIMEEQERKGSQF